MIIGLGGRKGGLTAEATWKIGNSKTLSRLSWQAHKNLRDYVGSDGGGGGDEDDDDDHYHHRHHRHGNDDDYP